MSEKNIIGKLNQHKFVSSWLLWDEGDDKGKGREWTNKLEINTQYVFVALNPSCKSDEFDIEEWGSFHTGKKGDLNLKLAFENTPAYKGCYITDILKYKNIENTKPFNNSSSNSVKDEVFRNYEIYSHNVTIFENELKNFVDVKAIFAFGWDAYRMLYFNPNIGGKYRVVRLPHFSPKNNKGKDYKAVINEVLDKYDDLPRLK